MVLFRSCTTAYGSFLRFVPGVQFFFVSTVGPIEGLKSGEGRSTASNQEQTRNGTHEADRALH